MTAPVVPESDFDRAWRNFCEQEEACQARMRELIAELSETRKALVEALS